MNRLKRLKRFGLFAGMAVMLVTAVSCDIGKKPVQREELSMQKDILRVTLFASSVPESYELIDWRGKALQYDRLVFDAEATGKYLPLIWEDRTHGTFGLPAYVGDPRYGQDGAQEAVAGIAAVLSGTLIGLDKSAGPDYVGQLAAYYSEDEMIILNFESP